MKKITIIYWNPNEIVGELLKYENVAIKSLYIWKKSKIGIYFSELLSRILPKVSRIVYNRDVLEKNDMIIIFDAMVHIEYIEWLKKNNPYSRIIFWYWNNEREYRISPEKLKKIGVEIWSFNKRDCEKYNLRYNSQFYSQKYALKFARTNETTKYDLIFVGREKNRNVLMAKLEEYCKNKNLYFFVYFVRNHFYEIFDKKAKNKSLQYHDFLELQLSAKAIVDWSTEYYDGLTLRVMEALYFNKKILTNSKTSMEEIGVESDSIFYSEGDEFDNLDIFLNSERIKENSVEEDRRNYYDFPNWCKRFEVQ